jgi:4-hydroxybenzoate polyprenyltransferase
MVILVKSITVIAFILAMAGVVWVLKEGGVVFALGALFATAIYQLGYRAKHGTWFNLID